MASVTKERISDPPRRLPEVLHGRVVRHAHPVALRLDRAGVNPWGGGTGDVSRFLHLARPGLLAGGARGLATPQPADAHALRLARFHAARSGRTPRCRGEPQEDDRSGGVLRCAAATHLPRALRTAPS